jgi:formylmethanofuran dehydrogenase subunit D
MKKTLFVLLLSIGTISAGFSADATTTSVRGDPIVELNDETLEYLTSRARVSVGTARGTVVDQLGQPQMMPHRDVWIFNGFRASNVFDSERHDTLIVVFKDDKVAKITLTKESTLREAAVRAKAAAPRVASAK